MYRPTGYAKTARITATDRKVHAGLLAAFEDACVSCGGVKVTDRKGVPHDIAPQT